MPKRFEITYTTLSSFAHLPEGDPDFTLQGDGHLPLDLELKREIFSVQAESHQQALDLFARYINTGEGPVEVHRESDIVVSWGDDLDSGDASDFPAPGVRVIELTS